MKLVLVVVTVAWSAAVIALVAVMPLPEADNPPVMARATP